jgi:hypothetical protein
MSSERFWASNSFPVTANTYTHALVEESKPDYAALIERGSQ